MINDICTEELFWDEIEKIGWGRTTTDYKAIERGLSSHWGPVFLQSFKKLFDEKYRELYKRITRFEESSGKSVGLGDDGFGDLLAHIIGLGKREFEAVMESPILAVKRAHKYDYKECFSYSFIFLKCAHPELTEEEALKKVMEENNLWDEGDESNEDLMLHCQMEALVLRKGTAVTRTPEYFSLWAKRQLPELEELSKSIFADQLGEPLSTLKETLQKVVNGDCSVVSSEVLKTLKKLQKKRETLAEKARQNLMILAPQHHGLENLFSDILESQ